MSDSAAFTTLRVIPVIDGVSDALNKQLSSLSGVGKTAGKQLGDSLAAGVEVAAKKVEAATDKVVKARDKEADAAGKLKTAEAQLQTLRDKGVDDAGRLAAAEEKVSAAKRKQQAASRDVAKVAKEEASANEQLAKAKKKVSDASDEGAAKGGRFSRWMGGLKQQSDDAGKSINGLSGKVKGLGSSLTSNLGLGASLGIASVVGGLVKMGDEFAQVNKTLSFTTGASGKALEDLNTSVKKIGKSAPFAMTDIATSIADVAKATQLTGQPLEDMTQRVMKLGRMGQQVDVKTLTQSMRAFGVPANQMAAQLDDMYRAAVSSGMGVGQLSEMALKGAPQFKQFGLNLNETATMMGTLHKAGIRGEAVTMGLNKAMIGLSKGGGDVKVKFKDAVGQISAYIKSGNTSEATAMAGKLFGIKSAGQFIEAIKQGKLNLDQMNGSLDKQKNGIMDAGGAVPTMSGAWQLLKNNVMIELEPIVTKLFTAMTNGIMWIREHGTGTISSLADKVKALANFFKENEVALSILKGVLAGVAAGYLAIKVQMLATFMAEKIRAMVTAVRAWTVATQGQTVAQRALNLAMKMNPIGLIVGLIVGLGVALWAFFTKTETGRKLWAKIWGGIKTAVSAVTNWFTNTAWPAIKKFFTGITDAVGTVLGFVKRNWRTIITIIGGPIGITVALVTKHWDKIKRVIAAVWNWISDTLWPGIKKVAGWIGDAWGKVGEYAGKAKDMVVEKFTTILNFFTGLPGKLANTAKTMWDGIKNSFKALINFLIKGWNGWAKKLSFTVPDLLGVPRRGEKIQPMPTIPEVQFGGGGYTGNLPVKAIAGVVHGDEQVIRSKSRRKIEAAHPGALDYMNEHGAIPGYEGGGYVTPAGLTGGKIQTGNPPNIGLTTDLQRWMWDQIRAVFGSATMMSGTRNASVGSGFDNHMGARAIDIVDSTSTMMRIANWIADKFPGTLELIHGPGFARQIKNGKIVGDGGGSTGFYAGAGRHDDHVHWAMDKIVGAAPTTGGDAGGGDAGSGDTSGSSDTSGSYDYSQGDKSEKKTKYDKDVADAKAKYDQDLAALKAKYRIGTTNNDLKAAGQQITRDKIELDRQRDAEINSAGGDKDKIKAIRDRYKPQYDALKTRRQDLSLQKIDSGNASAADKAAYDAAKKDLDDKFKKDKDDRKAAYDKALGELKDQAGKSYPTSISGWAGFAAQEFVGGQVADMLGIFGINDSPGALTALSELHNQVRVTDKSGKHIWGNYQSDGGSGASGPDSTEPKNSDEKTPPAGPLTGLGKNYPAQIVKAAKDLGLTKLAATIGVATGLVESGDPMKMYANSTVPESLKYPHDAVGSDHDSLGIFQQRAGAWGSVAERMDAYKSAQWFFRALQRVPNWETNPGGAAQAVQRSAFPDKYGQKMGRAGELVNEAKLFDHGGWLMPGQVGVNKTTQPEPILTRNQWADVSETIKIARAGGGGDVVGKLEQIRQMLARSGDQITVNGSVADDSLRKLRAAQDRKIRTKLGAL